MAQYCSEKFEKGGSPDEVLVCWRQDKHIHDATLINTIVRKLQETRGGTWYVRANSYRSHLQSIPTNGVMYADL